MKAIIKKVTWIKEYDTKFGLMNLFKIEYDNKSAFFSCKEKEQTYFIEGKEAEFDEEIKSNEKGQFITLHKKKEFKKNPFIKALKKEQSKYSGFAVSYTKDLIIAGKLDIKQWKEASKEIFYFMVELDKSIEND